jgi:hypothetical protein
MPDSWEIGPGREPGTIRLKPRGRDGIQILLEPGGSTDDPTNVHSGPYARVSDGRGKPQRIPLKTLQ